MSLIALVRILAIALWTCLVVPAQGCLMLLRIESDAVLRAFHRGVLVIAGVRLEYHGRRPSGRAALYVVNHCSWMDIFVLGAVLRGSFVAKSDVRRWPVLGFLSTLQDSLFIERSVGRLADQIDAVGRRLGQGRSLILFAEGTTGDGRAVLPFKSALFDPALRQRVLVYPVSLVYTHIAGRRLSRARPSPLAWYGDMTLLPHVARVFALSRITVRVEVHPPLDSRRFDHRKRLARRCRDIIAGAFAAAA